MKYIRRLILLIIIILLGYALFMAYFKLEDNEIGLVLDASSGSCEKVFAQKHNFIWQGVDLWRYVIVKRPDNGNITHTFELKIPLLKGLTDSRYLISIPLTMNYKINKSGMVNYSLLGRENLKLHKRLIVTVERDLAQKSEVFLKEYKPKELTEQLPVILSFVKETMNKNFSPSGITIASLDIQGTIYIPSMDVYNQGRKHLVNVLKNLDLTDIVSRNFSKTLERRELVHKQYLRHLEEVALLIRKYPHLIDYIYIDKFSHGKKSNIPIGDNGLPLFFRKNQKTAVNTKKPESQKTGEISNFKYE